MNHQLPFAVSKYQDQRHKTHKEKFLVWMETLVPWTIMIETIKPHYPKLGNGRHPYPLERICAFTLCNTGKA